MIQRMYSGKDRWLETSGRPLRGDTVSEADGNPPSFGSQDRSAAVKEWVLLVVVLLVGLGVRLPLLLADTETILTHWGSDDLFYFTEIASHLATGDGLTFDGIHPTTGVQPLWLLFLVPFGRWFVGNAPLALGVVHWMVTALTLVTAMLFPWVGRKFVEDGWTVGWLASLIWVAHPRVLGITFEGTEGALSALAWLVALGVWKRERQGTGFALFLGAVLGLGCLVRVDFLVPAMILLAFRPGGISPRPFRNFAVSAGALVLVAGTWPVMCWWITGSPLPDSGVAKALHAERLAEIQDSDSAGQPKWGAFSISAQGPRYLMTTGGRVSRISMVFVPISIALFVWMGRSRDRRWSVFPRTMSLVMGMWPLILASGCLLVLYPLVLRSMRSWYVIGPLLVMTLVTAAFLIDLLFRASKHKALVGSVAVVIWLAACNVEALYHPRHCWGATVVKMSTILQEHVAPGTRVGAFNAGILSAWKAPGTIVINLDGVVNHSAIVALRDRDLAGYIEKNGIEFIIDNEGALKFFDAIGGGGLHHRLRRLETLPLSQGPPLGVWRVDTKESVPPEERLESEG